MTKKVCLQAGHLNCQTNSIVALRSSTGAPGEMAFNEDMVNRVAEIFKTIPEISIVKTDANANDNNGIIGQDWDLFLAFHYDADIYNDSGGFIDFPEPSTDKATKESQRIAGVIGQVYFSKSGVKQVQKRSNANTRYYYMWKFLSALTPCVLLEFGVGARKPNDFNSLNTEDGRAETALIIAEAICKAFNVPFEVDDGSGSDAEQDIVQKAGYYNKIREMIGITKDRFSEVTARIEDLLKKESEYGNRVEQVDRLKGQITLLQEQITALENSKDDKDQVIKDLNTNITKLHDLVNQLGKDKGGLNDEIADLKIQLQECKDSKTIIVEPSDNFWQKLTEFVNNLFKGGAK